MIILDTDVMIDGLVGEWHFDVKKIEEVLEHG